MKILFVTHQNAFQQFGGAETALLMWEHYLKQKGIVCRQYSMYKDQFGDYDIVCLHNISQFPTEAFRILTLAKSEGAKVVVSPIFWSSLESSLEYGVGPNKVAHLLAWIVVMFVSKTGIDFGLQSNIRSMKLTLNQSDAIIVNSMAETNLISRFFSVKKQKIRVVYNGVDPSFKFASPEKFIEKYRWRDFLLYVGRIELRKNVLRLIKAFNRAALDTELVIIGRTPRISESYSSRCLMEAAKNPGKIHFLGHVKHSDELLKSAYAASKALVLPSFYETPGLSALEGAVAGANVVITDRGAPREYFSNFAFYVDPSSVESIAKGISIGYRSPRTESLRKHILDNFTWEKSTDQLERAFKSVI